uniref:Uncharacterized protein n=1 Tax=Plectus sambesii TaxID=2011161 RepID=A0A914UTE0_9BILA
MDGRVLISSIILVAGMILLLLGIGHNALTQGMSFADDNKALLLVLGIVFTLLGLTGFVYFLYDVLKRDDEECRNASVADYKDTTNFSANKKNAAAPFGDTP